MRFRSGNSGSDHSSNTLASIHNLSAVWPASHGAVPNSRNQMELLLDSTVMTIRLKGTLSMRMTLALSALLLVLGCGLQNEDSTDSVVVPVDSTEAAEPNTASESKPAQQPNSSNRGGNSDISQEKNNIRSSVSTVHPDSDIAGASVNRDQTNVDIANGPIVDEAAARAAFRKCVEKLYPEFEDSPWTSLVTEKTSQSQKLYAETISPKDAFARIDDTLTERERKQLIIFGTLNTLENHEGTCWAVRSSGGFGSELVGYLDQETGEAVLIWIVPEG